MIIKVCGMRDAENIRAVETLGIDWMGFICWPKSPRDVKERPAYLPACTRVGVFVDAEIDYIKSKIKQLGLNRLQLHGKETPERCQEIAKVTGLPITKAISIRSVEDLQHVSAYEGIADHFLFDTKCKCVGGSGEQFDWDILQNYHGSLPFLLAGGIGPEDALRVLHFSHPKFAGIDLNSRFEKEPALKDAEGLKLFLNQLNLQNIQVI